MQTSAPSQVEQEAILLVWRKDHPADSSPSAEETEVILEGIRERQERLESAALDILRQASHNQASRSGMNSRYGQFFWMIFCGCLVIGGLVYGVTSLIAWLQHR